MAGTNRKDMTGLIFGRLTILQYSHTQDNKAFWSCLCKCGNTTIKNGSAIRSGSVVSCGCRKYEALIENGKKGPRFKRKHGHRTPGKESLTYNSWLAMRSRCTNPKDKTYSYYGGRGITICDRWQTFINFLEDMGERSVGYTIDRIDVNGNYEPGNCRWADKKTQMNNRRID